MHESCNFSTSSLSLVISLSVCFFLRDIERQGASRGGAEREGDTESEAGSGLRAGSTEPGAGLELTVFSEGLGQMIFFSFDSCT